MDQLTQYAALADLVYHRANNDQPIHLSDINAGYTQWIPPIGSPGRDALTDAGMTISPDGFYYTERGFGGMVIQVGDQFIVVLRGTDAANVDPGVITTALATGTSNSNIDAQDIQQNVDMGLGRTTSTTQADDALALANAALIAAGNDKSKVTVVGQSLGAGLAGLVTAVLGVKGYGIALAPFDKQIDALAAIEAAKVLGIDREDISLVFSDPVAEAAVAAAAGAIGGPIAAEAAVAAWKANNLNAFTNKYGTQKLSDFTGETDQRIVEYRLNLALLEAHTNKGEALSNPTGILGAIFNASGSHFSTQPTFYDWGGGDEWKLHSPTGHLLAISTENIQGRAITQLFSESALLREVFFGSLAGVAGAMDTARSDQIETTSAVGASGPTPFILMRALWKGLFKDGSYDQQGLYEYFYTVFGEMLRSGVASEGKEDPIDGVGPSLYQGLSKIALGILRDSTQNTESLSDVRNRLGGTINFAGGGAEGDTYADKLVLDTRLITGTDPSQKDHTPSGWDRKFGEREINLAFWDKAAADLTAISLDPNQILFPRDFLASGANGFEWKIAVAQAGSADGPMNYSAKNDHRAGSTYDDQSHIVFGGAGADTISTSSVADFILGGEGNDTIDGAGGNDFIFAGSGDDVVVGRAGNSFVDGGAGNDWLYYGRELGVTKHSITALDDDPNVNGLRIEKVGGDVDKAYNFEHIRMNDDELIEPEDPDGPASIEIDTAPNADTVRLVGTLSALKRLDEVTINMGRQMAGSGDMLDLRQVDTKDQPLTIEDNQILGTEISFSRFEILRTGNIDTVLDGDITGFKEIHLGNGDNIVSGNLRGGDLSDNIPLDEDDPHPGPTPDPARANWVRLYLGSGDDIVTGGLARGSEIWVGEGENRVEFSGDVLVHDIDLDDRITWGGVTLTGGFRHADSDSAWMTGSFGLVQYAKNDAGQLAISDPLRLVYGRDARTMWIDNFEDSLNGPSTAGIHLFQYTFEVERLVANNFPNGWWVDSWRTVVGHMAKSITGTSFFEGVDPIVLDLDGDGLELTSVSYGSENRFDMDGDGFAEPTGWVKSDDGLLVRDENGNGTIDGIEDLVGSPSQSGFAELAAFDTNSDGVIDAAEAAAAGLKVWRDLNQNQQSEANELQTLAQAGISSISLNVTATPGKTNVTNGIAGEAQFTRTDGSTGTVSDVRFRIDNFMTTYLGDKTVSSRAGGQINLAGRGTLTDLRVALTKDEAATAAANPTNPPSGSPGHVADFIEELPGLLAAFTGNDLAQWRTAAMPIFSKWMSAIPIPTTADPSVVGLGTTPRSDIHLVTRTDDGNAPKVVDFLYRKHVTWTQDVGGVPTEMSGDFWYFASGRAVKDGNGIAIDRPTLQQAMGTSLGAGERYDLLEGAHIQFLERFLGDSFAIDPTSSAVANARTETIAGLEQLFNQFNRAVVRLGLQGIQATTTFAGLQYDAVEDDFNPTTDRGLVPLFEQVFTQATVSGGIATVKAWQEILAFVVSEFDRGDDYLKVTASYLFSNIVAAYENVSPSFGVVAAAGALGIDQTGIKTGAGTINGTSDAEIFYLGAGNQIAIGGAGDDAYVIGKDFGHDTIEDIEGPLTNQGEDVIRFAQYKSTDVVAYRNGTDLIIRTKIGDNELLVKRQFEGIAPALFGGDWSDDTGVKYVVFADGVSWDMGDLAKAVSHATDADETVIGTSTLDYLDGGKGNDYLSGGDWSDIYVFGKEYGQDIIADHQTQPLVDSTDILAFGIGINRSDIILSRNADSRDLQISLKDSTDKVTIQGQFAATYTGLLATQWLNRIEVFSFEKDFSLTANDVMNWLIKTAQTSGNDTVYGFDRRDTLEGGTGNDYLDGGNEADIYLFGRGDGQDVIADTWDNVFGDEDDVLSFKAGITLADIEVSRDNDDLILSIKNSTDKVTLKEQLDHQSFDRRAVETIKFADGTSISTISLYERLTTGTAGNDTIIGTGISDVMDGKAGDDYLNGGQGGDIYKFNVGSGHDTIHDSLVSVLLEGSDRIELGAAITTSNIRLTRTGNDLTISIDGYTDTLKIEGQFWSGLMNNRDMEIEQFHFADGTVWDRAKIETEVLRGTSGDEVIEGFDNDDVLDGKAGNDILRGGNGSDSYVFDRGYGHDTFDDTWSKFLSSDSDQVVFGAGITLSDLSFSRDGADVIITINDTGDTARLKNQAIITSGIDTTGIELFRFADGTVVTQQTIFNLLGTGTDGNDAIVGSDYGEEITGKKGNDDLKGGKGGDTYIYRRGDGNDVITEDWLFSGDDKLVFVGVTPADVSLVRIDGDVRLVIRESAPGAGDGGSVLLKASLRSAADSGVERIEFPDGTVWNQTYLRERVLAEAGTNGNDTIYGFSVVDDELRGGKGNDTLYGGEGSDTYKYSRGDGHDVVIDYWLQGDDDRLVLTNINPTDVFLTRSGSDVIVNVRESAVGAGDAGSITLKSSINSGSEGVEKVIFANGTVWTQADMRQLLLTAAGTDGDDTINGTSSSDLIAGGKGNDTLAGGNGADTYLYARGDGNDVINEYYYGTGPDKLVFTDIVSTEASLVRNGYDVRIVIPANAAGAGNGGEVLVTGGLDDNNIEQVIFADGVTWSASDMRVRVLAEASTSGNDTITGFFSNDLIEGGRGNDALAGANGSDTYRYSRGDGNDVISEYYYGSGVDKLIFTDISSTEIQLVRNGYDVRIVIPASPVGAGNGGEVLITAGLDENYIEQVIFADGISWSAANMRALVLAQASTAGNDTIDGFAFDDVITGGKGNDIIYGANGSDSFIYARGDGDDILSDYYYASGTDKLVFTDIASTQVKLQRVGNDVKVVVLESAPGIGDGSIVTLKDSYDGNGIDQIVFSNGTILNQADFRARFFADSKTAGDDTIVGFGTADTIDGGAGNDTLDGAGGVDTLIGGIGNDTYLVDAADFVIENAGEGIDTIKVNDNYALQVNVENLILTGTGAFSGTGNSDANRITGNTGNNSLSGGGGDDFLDGSAGTDTMAGGAGDDVYMVDNTGDITTENANEGIDTVYSSVTRTLSAEIENLVLTSSVALNGTGNGVANSITGNVAANTLDGGAGDDMLTGAGGNDILIGGTGNDTFIQTDFGDQVNGGDGTDKVTYAQATGGVTADLTTGQAYLANDASTVAGRYIRIYRSDSFEWIALTGLKVWANGVNVASGILSVIGGDNWYNGNQNNPAALTDASYGGPHNGANGASSNLAWVNGSKAYIQLDLGSVVNISSLEIWGRQDAYSGDSNNLRIYVTSTAPGSAKYNELATAPGTTTYEVGTLVGGTATLTAQKFDSLSSVENVDGSAFADSITGSAGANALNGNAGNDTINGQAGDDVLDGGSGDDQLVGGQGADEFRFGRNGGADLVDAYDTDGAADKLSVLSGVSSDQLWFSQSGNDLIVSIIGTSDSVTVQGWYQSVDRKLDRIQLADGKYATTSDVEQLRSAMAGFSPPPLGQLNLDTTTRQSLDATLAAAWH